MFTRPRNTALVLLSILLLPACTTGLLRIHSGNVPAGSLRVAQVVETEKRDDILEMDLVYKALIDAGIADSDLEDGSVVLARIYCCGGVTRNSSAEVSNASMLYVPRGTKVELGDFVEIRVGRPPEQGDGGRVNTVTRVVAKQADNPVSCWWDPKNPDLWLRVPYCEWMPKDGWVKQGGLYPAWFKPAP